MILPHLIPHSEEVSSDKEWLIPNCQPERVVVLGQVKLELVLVRLDKIVWKKVPRQTHVEKVIANWLQQHLRCSICSHATNDNTTSVVILKLCQRKYLKETQSGKWQIIS